MDGIYEPELIQKGQTRINGMDDKIIHCPLGVAWWCANYKCLISLVTDPYHKICDQNVNVLTAIFYVYSNLSLRVASTAQWL